MSLLEKHEQLLKLAEKQELQQERINIIVKYAEFAESKLAEAYGEDYTEDDVTELADKLINYDLAVAAEQEKVAEYDQLGRIVARAFLDEVEKSSNKE